MQALEVESSLFNVFCHCHGKNFLLVEKGHCEITHLPVTFLKQFRILAILGGLDLNKARACFSKWQNWCC